MLEELTPTQQIHIINYVTIATTGNAADFGDLAQEEVWSWRRML